MRSDEGFGGGLDAALIGGNWVGADEARRIAVRDPATGEQVGSVPDLGATSALAAVDAAAAALPAWASRTAAQRAAVLERWYALILEHGAALAELMTSEQGKPLAEARGELAYAASFVRWFAAEAVRVQGEVLPGASGDQRLLVVRQPVGVCAAITPWNFPAAMVTRKVAPALAAGCTVVLKPAEQTPLTALALARLAQQAGVPAGVLNVITGAPVPIGEALCDSPVVRKVSFTGSTEVGRWLMARCAPTLKRMSLELGGNAPFIVFDDADLDAAVAGALASKYRNAGQTCVCANRLIVQSGIHDAFVERLASALSEYAVGPGAVKGVRIGPLIDEAALDKVEALIADALEQGAVRVTGGQRHALGGTFFEPTVIAAATPQMRLAREEIFGPVAPVFRFSTEDEAVAMANATEYGLAAYCYTRDLGRAFRVSEALEYGMVGVNTGMISNEVAPFGGIKQSGVGREGSHLGIDEYLEVKAIHMGGLGG